MSNSRRSPPLPRKSNESAVGDHGVSDRTVSDANTDRAVSDVIGYVLIFAFIVGVIAFISVIGIAQLEEVREVEQFKNAERAFDVLENNMVEVYARGAPSRATELNVGEASVGTGGNVTLTVTVDGKTTERELNPIVLSGSGDTELVYEGGAVFRNQRDGGGVVVSEPPFTFSDKRTVVPIVHTYADTRRAVTGTTVLVRAVSTERGVAVADSDPTTSEFDQVTVSITDSPRQNLWREYFESQGEFDCTESATELSCERNIDDTEQTFVTVQSIEVILER